MFNNREIEMTKCDGVLVFTHTQLPQTRDLFIRQYCYHRQQKQTVGYLRHYFVCKTITMETELKLFQ